LDVDRAADAPGDRAAAGVKAVRALGGLSLVLRAAGQLISNANAFDHQHLVLDFHVAFSLAHEPAVAGVDPARLQRATQGAGQSTGSGCHDIIERRGVVGVEPGRGSVVLAHLVVGSENDGFGLHRHIGPADRASIANDPDLRYVFRLVHASTTTRAGRRIPLPRG